MLALIKLAGLQYVVKKDDIISVNKLDKEINDEIIVSDVLSKIEDSKVTIGTPIVENASVKFKVLQQTKNDKITVFKKKRRQNYRRKKGHKQPMTQLQVLEIN